MDRFIGKLKRGWESGGLFHPLKNWYLRKKYGAGCCDVFNLQYFLAPKILSALKVFRSKVGSYPPYMTMEEWEKHLDDMIYAFDYLVKDEEASFNQPKRVQKGLNAFGKYYQHLWL